MCLRLTDDLNKGLSDVISAEILVDSAAEGSIG